MGKALATWPDAAEAAGLPVIDIDIEHRDIDTPLSLLGQTQA